VTCAEDKEKKHITVNTFIPPSDVADEIAVVDGLGQRLMLGIENKRGGGGQRNISVFSRYWIVNTTEHCLRYKQENCNSYVSGNVFSPSRDGSKPIGSGRSHPRENGNEEDMPVQSDGNAIFAGKPGAIVTCDRGPEEVTSLLERDLSLRRLSQLAFMFSFLEGHVMSMGQQRLCVKLSDGRSEVDDYESDWSRGFSLDSIGISQVVSMHCKDGRTLELTMVVQKPLFSGKTSVIRFLPRYLVVNKLPYPVRILQDNSLFRHSDDGTRPAKWPLINARSTGTAEPSPYQSLWGTDQKEAGVRTSKMNKISSSRRPAAYVTTVNPSEIVPFFLP
jgi:hypothetical protein